MKRSVRAAVVLGDKVLWARRSDSNNRDGNWAAGEAGRRPEEGERLGWASGAGMLLRAGLAWNSQRRNESGCQGKLGQKRKRLHEKSFRIKSVLLSSKTKTSNTFKSNLSWVQIRINSNELFEDFSNLELLKIRFKYLNSNQGFINKRAFEMIQKRLQN
jgi:hypothetical protein